MDAVPPGELGARARLARLALGWGLVTAGGPGALAADGLWWLGALGVGVWAAAVARPGRRALRCEWAVAALAMGVQIWWIGYVLPLVVPVAAVVMGGYAALGGPVVRALVRGARPLPLALAAPAGWLFAEGLQHGLPIPFSWGWMRLGHLAAGDDWLVGSARVFGAVGLSAVVAGAGGAAADLFARRLRAGLVGALAWPAAALAAASLTAPPPTAPGPRLLLVQPAVPMARKQSAPAEELLEAQLELTRRALDALAAAGEPPPDAVVWAETMLPVPVLGPGVEEAVRAGRAELAPWHGTPDRLLDLPALERRIARELVLERTLPEPTSFLAGVEEWVVVDGRLRRTNVGALWERGRERRTAPKTHLVIGGETAYGLDELDLVRDLADRMAGYVPDLHPGERTEVLVLEAGGPWHLALTVCFDNAFVRPYVEPVRRGRVDAHLVLSNEAWYRRSFEFDQMVAFSRVVAAATGRAVVRCTNSGVTCLIGPDGRELDRIVVAGSDRAVAGTLLCTVPVPGPGAGAPPFTRFGPVWSVGLLVVALVAGPAAALFRARRIGR